MVVGGWWWSTATVTTIRGVGMTRLSPRVDASSRSELRVLDVTFGRTRGRGWSTPSGRKRSGSSAARCRAKDFEFWIAPLRVGRDGMTDELTLEVASQFARDWIAREYLALIERAVGLVGGRDAQRAAGRESPARRRHARARGAGSGCSGGRQGRTSAPARFTFDTFVVGASNAGRVPGRAAPSSRRPGSATTRSSSTAASASGRRTCCRRSAMRSAQPARRQGRARDGRALRQRHGRRRSGATRWTGSAIATAASARWSSTTCSSSRGKKRSQEEFAHTFNALARAREADRAGVRTGRRTSCRTWRRRSAAGSRPASWSTSCRPTRRSAGQLVERKADGARADAVDLRSSRYLADEWCANVRELEGDADAARRPSRRCCGRARSRSRWHARGAGAVRATAAHDRCARRSRASSARCAGTTT